MTNPKYTALLLCLLALLPAGLSAVSDRSEGLLRELDTVIENKADYAQTKEQHLANLLELLRHTSADEQRYSIYSDLYEGYLHYNLDSALVYAEFKNSAARRIGKKDYILDSRMNMARIYDMVGNYLESYELMRGIRVGDLSEYLRGYYYHIYNSLYRDLYESAITRNDKRRYKALMDSYRDSMMMSREADDIWNRLQMNEQYAFNGDYRAALDVLLPYYDEENTFSHFNAILAYSLARAYRGLDDRDNAIYYLALASINDLRTPIREYMALTELAVLLYEEGDVERAYRYISCSLEDAIASNSRIRMQSISEALPIINKAYGEYRLENEAKLKKLLLFIGILAILLVITTVVVANQMRRVSKARKDIQEANDKLSALNDELRGLNSKLLESNRIKEEYVGHYMDMCTEYIDKVDNYRKDLIRIHKSDGNTGLVKAITHPHFIEDELREFYQNFDSTFLHLFPDFVEKVNALLRDDEKLVPKSGRLMNKELRILALIRLGVTDSVKIASFLHCSLSTVYNYRTKLRNAARDAREDLEKAVGSIGTSE